MGGTPGDHTQREEKVEAKFIVLGPLPESLDPGTISRVFCLSSPPWISHAIILSFLYPKRRTPEDHHLSMNLEGRGALTTGLVHSLVLKRPLTPSSTQDGGRVLGRSSPGILSFKSGSPGT